MPRMSRREIGEGKKTEGEGTIQESRLAHGFSTALLGGIAANSSRAPTSVMGDRRPVEREEEDRVAAVQRCSAGGRWVTGKLQTTDEDRKSTV